ncbi:MAG: hypothetical protein ACC658_16880, partial [Acidimicrobiia bacterium]
MFLFFTDDAGDSQIVEGIVSGTSPPTMDPDSLRLILEIPQEHRWHQSGSMIFGPDGYLWVSIGDGGGIGDPEGSGQNPRTLKGTVLKLDIDWASALRSGVSAFLARLKDLFSRLAGWRPAGADRDPRRKLAPFAPDGGSVIASYVHAN